MEIDKLNLIGGAFACFIAGCMVSILACEIFNIPIC